MPLSKRVFALAGLLSLFASPCFANDSSPSLTVFTQYKAETSYYNTWENAALYDPRWNEWFQLGLGAKVGFSKNDFESLQYKVEPAILQGKWFEAHLRLSRKIFLPDTTSFTHGLLYFKLQTPALSHFRFFTKLGWFYRFWELNHASIFPVPVSTTYTDYDFALGLGVEFQPGSVFFAKLHTATFDELDVFNLNHPFAEIVGGLWLTDFWTLSAFYKYQVSLGFGRLDRTIIGLTMDFLTDRYWD